MKIDQREWKYKDKKKSEGIRKGTDQQIDVQPGGPAVSGVCADCRTRYYGIATLGNLHSTIPILKLRQRRRRTMGLGEECSGELDFRSDNSNNGPIVRPCLFHVSKSNLTLVSMQDQIWLPAAGKWGFLTKMTWMQCPDSSFM